MAMWRGDGSKRMAHGVYRRPHLDRRMRRPKQTGQARPLSLQLILEKDVHLGGLSALETTDMSITFSLGRSHLSLYGDVRPGSGGCPAQRAVRDRDRYFGDAKMGIDGPRASSS